MNTAIPKEEIQRRITGLQTRLAAGNLDAAILNHSVDVYYFAGTRQNSVLWIPQKGSPILLARKSFSRAQTESSIADIRPFPSSSELPAVLGQDVKKVGMTFDVLPVQYLSFYQKIFPDHEFSDISAMNRELRSVKSAWELAQMRLGGETLSGIFRQIPGFLKPGMREIDLAAEIEYRLRKAGIGGCFRMRGFNQEINGIALSGKNAAVPGCFDGPVTGQGIWTAAPYGPSTDLISESLPVIVDYGGFFNGYYVDMTRIFSFGSLDPELDHAFRLSLHIQQWITEHLVPGKTCEEIFFGARQLAIDAGLADNFMGPPGAQSKFVGHGVGLELDEAPVLAPKFREPLKVGNTIAVEPKFLFPGKGAVGIENTFAVMQDGYEKLTVLPDDIIYL